VIARRLVKWKDCSRGYGGGCIFRCVVQSGKGIWAGSLSWRFAEQDALLSKVSNDEVDARSAVSGSGRETYTQAEVVNAKHQRVQKVREWSSRGPIKGFPRAENMQDQDISPDPGLEENFPSAPFYRTDPTMALQA